MTQVQEALLKLRQEVGKKIIGQQDAIDLMFVALLSRGHALLIGVPGLAKTLLISTLSKALNLDFSRIQFTPDLMPSDITGTEIIQDNHEGGKSFKFIKGPLFANIVLADEINRTPPKTQAALLEAMQEQHVTASGTTYTLESPFFVLATQNPIEQEGTYPLPEAQLDRFMLNLWLDYPSFEEEVTVVRNTTAQQKDDVKAVITGAELIQFQEWVRQVPVADNVIEYAVRLVGRTRPKSADAPQFVKDYLAWGAGPRASQALILGAKAVALMDGRTDVHIADVQKLAIPVLRHRIFPNFNAEADGVDAVQVIQRLLAL